jgi:competence protein ComEC
VTARVLAPNEEETHGTTNDGSIVLRLQYGRTAFLLTGDAEQEAEARMIGAGLSLQADVLKVGHHGGSRSTSAPFVAAVNPGLAVIQVGAGNRFGHPDAQVLDRLRGIRLLRTDQDGRVEVVVDGQSLWARSERQPSTELLSP